MSGMEHVQQCLAGPHWIQHRELVQARRFRSYHPQYPLTLQSAPLMQPFFWWLGCVAAWRRRKSNLEYRRSQGNRDQRRGLDGAGLNYRFINECSGCVCSCKEKLDMEGSQKSEIRREERRHGAVLVDPTKGGRTGVERVIHAKACMNPFGSAAAERSFQFRLLEQRENRMIESEWILSGSERRTPK
jgi:hypothetical protein